MDVRSEAHVAFTAGRYEDALRLFTLTIEQGGAAADDASLCNRSAVLFRLGRFAEAADDARAALRLLPPERCVKAHYRLACALFAADAPSEALISIEAALSLTPDSAQLTSLRDRCLESLLAPFSECLPQPAEGSPPLPPPSQPVRATGAIRISSCRLPPPPGHQPSELPPSEPTPPVAEPVAALIAHPAAAPATTPSVWRRLGVLAAGASRWALSSLQALHIRWASWRLWVLERWTWPAGRLKAPLPEDPHATEPPELSAQPEPAVAAAAADSERSATSTERSANARAESVGLSSLPSEVLLDAVSGLRLMDLIHLRCVNKQIACDVRRLLAWRGVSVPAGTYVFSASWEEAHPSAVWPEEDRVTLDATGTITLLERHRAPLPHGVTDGDAGEGGWSGGVSGSCSLSDGRSIVSTCWGCWKEGGEGSAPPAEGREAWGEGPRGVWARATSGGGARLRIWWTHDPPNTVLLHDERRMRSELIVHDLSVQRAAVSAHSQTWLLSGTWLGLPPRSSLASGADGALATGAVRFEMRLLYAPGEGEPLRGAPPCAPLSAPPSSAGRSTQEVTSTY